MEQFTRFTEAFLTQVLELQSDVENTCFSPLSIYLALGMALVGTKKKTRDQLRHTLCIPEDMTDEDWHQYIVYTIVSTIKSCQKVKLNLANKMFLTKDFELQKDFLKMLSKYYDSGCESITTGNDEAKRKYINFWVRNVTDSKIKELLPGGSINQGTLLVLVNALLFKGSWENKFREEETQQADFHLLDGKTTIKVPMMSQNYMMSHQYHTDELDAQSVRIPFGQEGWYFMILLPNRRDGLPSLVKNIARPDVLFNVLQQNVRKYKVDICLPKFKMLEPAKIEAKKILSLLGVNDLFVEDKCDLSGITLQRDLVVSDVIHKAVIEVDEYGAEASAATAMAMRVAYSARREHERRNFYVDHPFMFMIVMNNGKCPVFIGYVVDPR